MVSRVGTRILMSGRSTSRSSRHHDPPAGAGAPPRPHRYIIPLARYGGTMRRLSLLPLVLALALALVACGGSKSPTPGGDSSGDDGSTVVLSSVVGGPSSP